MRYLIAISSAVLLAGALVAAAAAAPKADGPKTNTVPVDCGDLGSFEVITLENESVVAWTPDGGVLVVKRFAGEFNATITTFDGNTYPFTDSFEDELAKGNGFQDRLIRCNFSETESETFILDAEFAAFVGIPESYVGTEVTLAGTFDGTAWVIPAGR